MYNEFPSVSEFNKYLESRESIALREKESEISRRIRDQEHSSLSGYCKCCESEQEFIVDLQYSDGHRVNFRERLVCPSCGLNNRQRLMAGYIFEVCKTSQAHSIYIHEQITPFYAYLKQHLESAGIRVVGSEYVGGDIPSGKIVNGILHEDILRLSFEAEQFDIIVSNDVLEHVSDIRRALAESNRVLSSTGKMIFSCPFHLLCETTIKRAEISGGV
jgi:SAM-dependent methyltransferase